MSWALLNAYTGPMTYLALLKKVRIWVTPMKSFLPLCPPSLEWPREL